MPSTLLLAIKITRYQKCDRDCGSSFLSEKIRNVFSSLCRCGWLRLAATAETKKEAQKQGATCPCLAARPCSLVIIAVWIATSSQSTAIACCLLLLFSIDITIARPISSRLYRYRGVIMSCCCCSLYNICLQFIPIAHLCPFHRGSSDKAHCLLLVYALSLLIASDANYMHFVTRQRYTHVVKIIERDINIAITLEIIINVCVYIGKFLQTSVAHYFLITWD